MEGRKEGTEVGRIGLVGQVGKTAQSREIERSRSS